VSRQTRQPAAGGGSAEIVSIGIGGSRRPDYSRLACGQVSAARRMLGLDREDFAGFIREATGWDMSPEGIAAWEDDVEPPGSVVIACSEITRGIPVPASPLLAAVPPAFPAGALAGPWVTAYRFSHNASPRFHADVARVTAESGDRIRAVNHPPEPRSEGRARSFRNEIAATLAGRHLIGEWRNTSDTRYYGTVQLAVMPGESVMHGWFCGVGSDVEVSNGSWKWVRLAADPDADLAGITLREPAELHDLVMTHGQNDPPLLLAEVREKF
jgi:hypothetical protein